MKLSIPTEISIARLLQSQADKAGDYRVSCTEERYALALRALALRQIANRRVNRMIRTTGWSSVEREIQRMPLIAIGKATDRVESLLETL